MALYELFHIFCEKMDEKGSHCCSVKKLKMTFVSICNHGYKDSGVLHAFSGLFEILAST